MIIHFLSIIAWIIDVLFWSIVKFHASFEDTLEIFWEILFEFSFSRSLAFYFD